MKSFLEIIEEETGKEKHAVMAFGRMNPPTTGHLKLIDKVREVASKHKTKPTVVVSHSQDAKKNPLSGDQKVKHLKRYSPGTHFETSSKEHPTIMHHAAKLHAQGADHLHVIAGSDRVKEMHSLLHKYNGVKAGHGHYNFKKITVHSAGHRDPDAEGAEGMSGTKMREHAKNNDFSSFRQGVPHHVKDEHARELMKDVRKGMGLHESYTHGHHKAIFVTGGPGSGKDVVLREAIAEARAVELNFTQVMDILNDKHKLAMRSMNPRFEAVRTRGPLIINGPADDLERIGHIKEELHELGYQTMMIFVDTTNSVSKQRNSHLARMMAESVRQSKWEKAHKNVNVFTEMFGTFMYFDNSDSLDLKEEEITDLYRSTSDFLGESVYNESNRFLNLYEGAKDIQKTNLKDKGFKVLKDNNSPVMQFAAKLGKRDDVRDGDIKQNSNYATRIGGGHTYTESGPVLTKNPEPVEKRFNMDANKTKLLKRGNRSLSAARIGTADGVGSTFDSRATTGAAGAGLGDQTYRESTEFNNDDVADFAGKPRMVSPNPLAEKKRSLKKFKESIFDFGLTGQSGVSGTLGGASNKEPLETPADKYGQSGITFKKKKKTGEK
jgi:nicotinamide mononucleotide adenylyltransferase